MTKTALCLIKIKFAQLSLKLSVFVCKMCYIVDGAAVRLYVRRKSLHSVITLSSFSQSAVTLSACRLTPTSVTLHGSTPPERSLQVCLAHC